MDVLRSMCCLLCLQAEGGKKAAVATVMAAVDLARVRQPVHAEGGPAEEEECVEAELRQQAGWTVRAQACQTLTAAHDVSPEPALPPPQVRQVVITKKPPD